MPLLASWGQFAGRPEFQRRSNLLWAENELIDSSRNWTLLSVTSNSALKCSWQLSTPTDLHKHAVLSFTENFKTTPADPLFSGMGTCNRCWQSRGLLLGNISALTVTGLLPASHRERGANWKISHQALSLHISPSLAGPSSFKSPFPAELSEENEKSFF